MSVLLHFIPLQYYHRSVLVRNFTYWTSLEILETFFAIFTGIYLAAKRLALNIVFNILFISRIDKVRLYFVKTCQSNFRTYVWKKLNWKQMKNSLLLLFAPAPITWGRNNYYDTNRRLLWEIIYLSSVVFRKFSLRTNHSPIELPNFQSSIVIIKTIDTVIFTTQ